MLIIVIKVKDIDVLLDDEDYSLLDDRKIYIHKDYIFVKINGKKISLSKFLFNIKSNEMAVHKNGNAYDYTRSNILITTRAEYSRRRKIPRKSKYKMFIGQLKITCG